MLQFEVLVLEIVSVDALSSGAVPFSNVSALDHEAWDNSVELGVLVAQLGAIFLEPSLCKFDEVLGSEWNFLSEHCNLNTSNFLVLDSNVKPHLLSDF